jgi:NAD(P)-dependent dehydrogenase (short-subunit alcohol dehydrogenase family)
VSSGAGSLEGLTRYEGAAASYGLSKLALNGLTIKMAAELEGTGILVNAVCPGYTQTDLTNRDQAARPVEAGAASVVWTALLPKDGPTGGFFRDGKRLQW